MGGGFKELNVKEQKNSEVYFFHFPLGLAAPADDDDVGHNKTVPSLC